MNRPEGRVADLTVTVTVAVLLVAGVGIAAGAVGSVGVGDEATSSADETVSEAAVLDGSHAIDPESTAPADIGEDTIGVRHELSMNDEPGTVDVTTEVRLPDPVTEFRLTVLSATDGSIAADGFDREATDNGEEEWVWDGETTRPSLSYAMEGNLTEEPEGPLAGDGRYRFVDAGDWAIVRPPRVSANWRHTGGVSSLERENAVDGEGVASQAIVYLGPYEEHVHEGASQRFRLIVPDAAELEPPPSAVFRAFENASSALQVGARDDTVLAVAAPTGSVSWAVRGLQIGDADLWVRDAEPVDAVDDVWTHEYVHTRQSYRTQESARWFTEATATYYAALFALERGDIEFEAFERALSAGERDPYADSVLAAPDTWAADADYVKGALVAGELDRRIRMATDGRASLATAFRAFNDAPVDRNDPDTWLTNEDFLDAVQDAAAEGGDDAVAAEIRDEAERLTTTDATPEVWSREAHAEAFGETPARVGYGLDDEGVRAVGEYRDRAIDHDPARLVEGERLTLAVRVSNTGGTAGSYEVSMRVDGEIVATQAGSVDAGAETIERFDHEFEDAGEYEVRVGSETLDVIVSEPGPVSVRNVTTDADGVVAGESVRVSATVGNDADTPAEGPVEVLVNGDSVGSHPVTLDTGANTTVERDVVLDVAGTTTITVVGPENEASVSVTVEEPGGTDDSADDGEASVPGFGVVVATIALLLTVGRLARRG